MVAAGTRLVCIANVARLYPFEHVKAPALARRIIPDEMDRPIAANESRLKCLAHGRPQSLGQCGLFATQGNDVAGNFDAGSAATAALTRRGALARQAAPWPPFSCSLSIRRGNLAASSN